MSAGVLALVVIAAFAHAAWNLTMKRAGTSGVRFLWLTFLVGAVVFLPFGLPSLLAAGVEFSRLVVLAAVSGILQLLYFVVLQRGYRLADVSVVYPLARGIAPLLSVTFAIVLFSEAPTWLGLAGAAIVIAGVVVIGLSGGAARLDRAGIGYGLLVGIMIAAYTLWDAHAVTEQRMPPVGYYWASVVVQAVVFAFPSLRSARDTWQEGRRHWLAVLVVGILCPLAYMLILVAFQQAQVSIVAPAREISVVVVGLAGWLIFREPHPIQRLVGAGVVVAGVTLLALA